MHDRAARPVSGMADGGGAKQFGIGCVTLLLIIAVIVGIEIGVDKLRGSPAITVRHAPAHPPRVGLADLRERGRGSRAITSGACRLIDDQAVKSVLPQARHIVRAVAESPPSRSVPFRAGWCRVEFDIPHVGNQKGHAEPVGLEVSVRAAGDPRMVERQFDTEYRVTESIGSATCIEVPRQGYSCQDGWIAFEVLGRLDGDRRLEFPHQHGDDYEDTMRYYVDHVLPEYVKLITTETR